MARTLVLFFIVASAPLLMATTRYAAPAGIDIPVRNGRFFQDAHIRSGAGFRITNDAGAFFWREYERQGGAPRLGVPISRRFICGADLCQATEHALLRWRFDGDGTLERVSIWRTLYRLGYADGLTSLPPHGVLARDAGYIPDAALTPEQIGDAVLPDMPALSDEGVAVAQAAMRSVVKIEVGVDDFGSGVIFDRRGYVLTNQHVVASSQDVSVVLSDGRRFPGMVIGSNEMADVAVVKVDAPGLTSLSLGDSSLVHEGDEIVVIGYTPLLSESPSARTGTVRFAGAAHGHILRPPVIQTDAFVHPGDSGGPLLNLQGQIVGLTESMTTTRNSPSALRSNALASNPVRVVVEQLLAQAGR